MRKLVSLLYVSSKIVFSLLIALQSVAVWSQTESGKLSQVTITGNELWTDGSPLRLCGVSLSDPDKLQRAGHWNLEYFQLAKSWGCNVVRLPIHTYTWRYRGEKDYLHLLDQGVEWARQTGMYVILDWHAIGNMAADAWPGFNYMTNKKETCRFWKTMARHFKGNTTVALFELFNEPEEEGAALTWSQWRPLMESLVDSIRAVDSNRLCAVAGMDWAYKLDSVVTHPIRRSGIAYVTHPYPMKREQPWVEMWQQDFGHVAAVYPVIATELGYVVKGERGEHVPCIGDETYGRAIMDFLKERGISYTIWCFDPDWAPALLEDYEGTPTPRQGAFFKNVLQNEITKK